MTGYVSSTCIIRQIYAPKKYQKMAENILQNTKLFYSKIYF